MSALTRVRLAYARIEAVDRPEIWIDLRPRAEAEREARAVDERVAAGERLPLMRQAPGREGQHRRGGPAHHRRIARPTPTHRRPTPPRSPASARPEPSCSAPPTWTSSPPVWSAPAHRTAPSGAPWTRKGSAAAPARDRPWRWPWASSTWRSARTPCGSGRVPAAFNGVVGLKPTRGLVPTTGVVPACASLDCVTVFARTLPEAEQALAHLTSPSGRELPPLAQRAPGPWRVAVPPTAQLGELDEGWAQAYEAAVNRLITAGAQVRTLDLTPFTEAAAMLYEGAFVAERYTAVGNFVDKLTSEGAPGSTRPSRESSPARGTSRPTSSTRTRSAWPPCAPGPSRNWPTPTRCSCPPRPAIPRSPRSPPTRWAPTPAWAASPTPRTCSTWRRSPFRPGGHPREVLSA